MKPYSPHGLGPRSGDQGGVDLPQGCSPSCGTLSAAGPTRTAVGIVGRFPTATVGPELGLPLLPNRCFSCGLFCQGV